MQQGYQGRGDYDAPVRFTQGQPTYETSKSQYCIQMEYIEQHYSSNYQSSNEVTRTLRLMYDGNVFMYNEEQRTWKYNEAARVPHSPQQHHISNYSQQNRQNFSHHQTPQPEITIPRDAKLELLVQSNAGDYVKSAEGSFPQNIRSGEYPFTLETFRRIGIFLSDPENAVNSYKKKSNFITNIKNCKSMLGHYANLYNPILLSLALPALSAVCCGKYAPKAAEYFGYNALTNSTLYNLGIRVVSFVAFGAGAIFLENKAVEYMHYNLECEKDLSSILKTVANNILNRNSGEYNPDYQHTKPQHPYAKHAPTAYTALMYCGAAYVMVSNIESPIIKYLSIATATTLTAAATYLATPSDENYVVM